MHNAFLRFTACSIALFFAAAPAYAGADLVIFELTAEITTFDNSGGDLPPLSEGTVIFGRYMFDGAAEGSSQPPGSGSGQFTDAMYFGEVTLAGERFLALSPPGQPETLRQILTHDYDIEASEPELYRAALEALPTSELSEYAVLLTDPGSSTGIMGTDLPTLPPDPSAFATAELQIVSAAGSQIVANIQTLTLPEPGAGAGAAALALGLLARRRRSNKI